jgi:hypothetical protein
MEVDHMKDIGINGRITLKTNIQEIQWGAWNGLI